nr:hypothetical protein [uncultured Gellertiella sp.]
MKNFTLNSLINGDPKNPIRPGESLNVVGKYLGTPDWWDFGGTDPFSGLIGYGDFQFELLANGGRIEISRIGIELWEASDGEPVAKRDKIKLAKGVDVDLSGYVPGINCDEVKSKLKHGRISFSERFRNDSSDVKTIISLYNKIEFYFFNMNNNLGLAEMHFNL